MKVFNCHFDDKRGEISLIEEVSPDIKMTRKFKSFWHNAEPVPQGGKGKSI
jgi:hypothetical protein